MAHVTFTSNLERHIACPNVDVSASTVREALDAVFGEHPQLRGYVLDDQGRLRTHMVVFVDGTNIKDREKLSDNLAADSQVYVMQALSGG